MWIQPNLKLNLKKNKDSFYEKFWIENSGFWGEYKFRLIENKWYLVYAVDHNLLENFK